MYKKVEKFIFILITLFSFSFVDAQIGRRFPSERKVIKDPVTGNKLIFLTSTPIGDSKIYQTHNQWTSDGKWLIFKSNRVKGEAFAVHEKTGEIIQVTEGGFTGMLNVARKSMNLYFMRKIEGDSLGNKLSIVEVNLAQLFTDSKSGRLRDKSAYERICGITSPELQAGGDMALDGDEEWVWFRVGKEYAAKHLPAETKIEPNFGPRNMGAGPAGIAGMNLKTGEIKYVISVPFQVGHLQTNPWVPGQIVFCWETGGKSPQRTWTVNSDGSGLRPLYPEANFEWVTHEAVISPDEVAIAIMGHRKILTETDTTGFKGTDVSGANPGQDKGWGNCGTREKPTGLGIVNINTREMTIAGQTASGSGFWHVSGSADKRFVVGDDFARNIYLINRRTNEMMLLSAGHKPTAADHPHPTFSPDGTKIQIQSAMLSADNKSMNICVIPVPKKWLKKKQNQL
jgi:oligogalacturonide lyase